MLQMMLHTSCGKKLRTNMYCCGGQRSQILPLKVDPTTREAADFYSRSSRLAPTAGLLLSVIFWLVKANYFDQQLHVVPCHDTDIFRFRILRVRRHLAKKETLEEYLS